MYLTSPVGIGEHPDIIAAIDSEIFAICSKFSFPRFFKASFAFPARELFEFEFEIFSSNGQSLAEQLAIFKISNPISAAMSTELSSNGVQIGIIFSFFTLSSKVL